MSDRRGMPDASSKGDVSSTLDASSKGDVSSTLDASPTLDASSKVDASPTPDVSSKVGASSRVDVVARLPAFDDCELDSDEAALADELAGILHDRFEAFHTRFIEITARAEARFLNRDWIGHQRDAAERLQVHTKEVAQTVEFCRQLLPDAGAAGPAAQRASQSLDDIQRSLGDAGAAGPAAQRASQSLDDIQHPLGDASADGSAAQRARRVWVGAQRRYVALVSGRGDMELAESLYNSVTRRLFNIFGLDRELEFIWLGPTVLPAEDTDIREFTSFEVTSSIEATVRDILSHCPLGIHFADRDRDARLVAQRVDEYLHGSWLDIDAFDVLDAVFYRNRGAYLIGRMKWLNRVSPFILPILNDQSGVYVDAALLTEAATSRLFSYARSYMHVLSRRPARIIAFLKSMLPVKPVAELYTSLGYSQHGKTNLFRALFRHMEHSNTRFEESRGAAGMVMAVFTLPSFDVVFKVIKDRFPLVKKITPEGVKRRYRLVFGYDRVGRLVDAQEFENLTFARDRFDEELLAELERDCSRTVTITRDEVILGHVYTERRVYPLDLYLREMSPERAREAAIDYGRAIKDLAAANIFPGDLFPKNFGVTRLGAVVFYDYDELALLSEINFRALPTAQNEADEMMNDPWFSVGPNDVFPEEFATFLRSPPVLEETFFEHHSEIVTVEFWRRMQERQYTGDVPEFFPYHSSMKLR